MNQPEQTKPTSKLIISIQLSAWKKDSHNLYDYSEQQMNTKNKHYQLPIKTKTIYLLRNHKTGQSVLQVKQKQVQKRKKDKTNTLVPVCKIGITPNLESRKLNFVIEEIGDGMGKPGLAVGREKDVEGIAKGCVLRVGHVIYFGKVKYLVRQLKAGKNLQTFNPISIPLPTPPTEQAQQQQQQQDDKQECRICMDSSTTPSNPLISICKCTGSCRYSHFECLKHWMEMKMVLTTRDYCVSADKIDCEICKAEIPMSVNCGGGHKEQLLFIDRPKGEDYVMLQKISGPQKNILIIKSPPYEGLSIGRDPSSYIKIPDISVSRIHAFLRSQGGQFLIHDNKSKFGTLLTQMEEPLRLEIGTSVRCVQIGRTVLEVGVRKETRVLGEL